jgi:hypothetical protein
MAGGLAICKHKVGLGFLTISFAGLTGRSSKFQSTIFTNEASHQKNMKMVPQVYIVSREAQAN